MVKFQIIARSPEGWHRVYWAPMFDTEAEANAWLEEDHDWDCQIDILEVELDA